MAGQAEGVEQERGWRRKLRHFRLAEELSFAELGQFLGVHGTTLRAWEYGIRHCSPERMGGRLHQLLDGDYEGCVRPFLGLLEGQEGTRSWTDEVFLAFAMLSRLLARCRYNAPLEQRVLDSLDDLEKKLLKDFSGGANALR
ncbi:MAG: helix-turn-helix transcriptional regulator [Victivallales bacterium]|nr:helix-turn-helix transcriptional regulator [Victivallales bacterium]